MSTATALAMTGGEPALPPGAHRPWPQIDASDRAAVARVLDGGELWGPNAPEVTALAEEWAAYVERRHCVVVNSGTAALHCALAAAGVGSGDEVVVPAFGFAATPMAVVHQGATPVFCDIDPALHALDPRKAEALVGPRTKAIVPVHAHGLPADMDELARLARRHGLALIEDAAQAHGARYRGRPAGALGDSAAFSLNGSKNLSAGEGGLFVTDDEEAFVAARRLAIFGEDTPPTTAPGQYRAYWSHGVGWNYRGHELTAALARSQLPRLDAFNRTARRNARALSALLADLPGLHAPVVPDDRSSAFYRYRIQVEPEELGWEGSPLELRDRLLWALQSEGVAASLWQLRPLPEQPVFRGLHPEPGAYPVTSRLLESSFVIGTAEHHLAAQPAELMDRYAEAFEKVVSSLDTVFTADYVPVRPWPPPDAP